MAVQRPAALTKLISTFARIYPDPASSRMVVVRAGIDETMIAFDPRSAVNWTEIVNYALRNDALDALIGASGDEDLHPELVPDMQALLADYRKWAATHAATPEAVERIAAQPAPKFLEVARTTILSWSSIAIVCFGIAGAFARESRHVFLGLPGSHTNDLLHEPGSYASEGFAFLRDTIATAAHYAFSLNPLGALVVTAIIAGVIVLIRREPRVRRRFTRPAMVIPLIVIGAIAKTLWYDLPVASFAETATRDYHPDAVIAMSMFRTPAKARWTSIVCSRIAGESRGAQLCGNERRSEHRQNVEGSYLLNVIFTAALCTIGVFVIRKILLPSRDRAWNLSRRRKWNAAIAVGIAVLFALLPLPWTFSRTVRSTQEPYVCPPGVNCFFRVCAESDECYKYDLDEGQRFTRMGDVPENARERSEDLLRFKFEKDLTREDVDAPIEGLP